MKRRSRLSRWPSRRASPLRQSPAPQARTRTPRPPSWARSTSAARRPRYPCATSVRPVRRCGCRPRSWRRGYDSEAHQGGVEQDGRRLVGESPQPVRVQREVAYRRVLHRHGREGEQGEAGHRQGVGAVLRDHGQDRGRHEAHPLQERLGRGRLGACTTVSSLGTVGEEVMASLHPLRALATLRVARRRLR